MNIEVTRDNVTILEQSETPHENEYRITTCYFTFDEFTSSFQVKRAIFTILSTGEMYETDIINNQCDIPSEVLKHEYETVKLGVYGYNIGENEELLNRFSPSYAEIVVPTGSYKEGALSPEPITPSQYDLYSQALQEGLQEVDDKLDEVVDTVDGKIEEVDSKLIEVDTTVNNKMTEVDNKIGEVDDKLDEVDDKIAEVDTAIAETNNLNLDVSDKVDGDVTVTLTKKDASTKSVVISDGTSLMFNWDGTKLGVKTDEDSEYVYVDLQGIQGVPGPQGEPFRIKKTYSSVTEMNADFNNMEYGDYVMIASTVEVEDNAKLYTRGEREWIFITDFSGATGIKGETGATPNIQIGTVTSGSVPSVTRTGTNENPVLNFVLQPGEKGNTGDTGATGNGIASITKTSTTGLVDTYTITFTDGNTTTFNVENGNGIDHISLTSQSGATKVYTIYYTDGTTSEYTVQDGEVTQEVFDEEVERLKMVYNAMPKVSGEGTDLTLDNTAKCPVYDIELSPSELEQETTTGKNVLPIIDGEQTYNGITCKIENGKITLSGTSTTNYIWIKLTNGIDFFQGTPSPSNKPAWFSNQSITGETYSFSKIGTTKAFFYTTTSERKILFDENQQTNTIDLSSETLSEVIYYVGGSGTTVNESFYLQAVKGSTPDTDFEPFTYGASPNPQYPQEIHTVSGENTVVVGNKNLVDTSIIETGNIDTSTGEESYGIFKITKDFIKVTPNETYSFQYVTTATGKQIVIYEYGASKNFTGFKVISATSGSQVLSSTTEYIKLRFSSATNSQPVDISNVQVEKSSNVTDYVEHQEQSLPLSLGDLEYCKIGDYEDEFMKPSGKNLINEIITNSRVWSNGIIGSNDNYSRTDYIQIEADTSYYIQHTVGGNVGFAGWYYDKDKNPISNITIWGDYDVSSSFTTPSNAKYIIINFYNQTINTIPPMLNKGTTALPYEPYDNGKWYLKKNISHEVFDGVDNAVTSVGNSNNVYYGIIARVNNTFKSPVNDDPPKSNYYRGGIPSVVAGRIYVATSKNLVMCDTGSSLTTKELWNAWLKEKYDNNNPVEIWYIAYEPTYTLLSDTLQTQLDNIQKAISYQDQTNVSQTNNDLPFVIKLSAIRDLSGIFELIQ